MNTRIKIIKQNRNTKPQVDSSTARPAEAKTREMANTVKSWIAEFKEGKRMQLSLECDAWHRTQGGLYD